MKKAIFVSKFLLPILVMLAFACRKSITDNSSNPPLPDFRQPDSATMDQPIPYPQHVVTGCPSAPDYGDSILYAQPMPTGQDYILNPVNNPGAGTYLSWPAGMVIDLHSGAIDVTQSQTGARYTLAFVKSGTQDTCVQTIILAGADYLDSVYILADSESTAAPYFDANPAITNLCSANGATNGQACKWDLTKSATVSKLAVNPQTGVIDLQKSLSQGAFGLVPLDGATITPDIYYTLRDKSNQAVQHIQIQFIYYSSAALIPTALTNEIAGRRLNALLNKLINLNPSPRPPIVIISRFH